MIALALSLTLAVAPEPSPDAPPLEHEGEPEPAAELDEPSAEPAPAWEEPAPPADGGFGSVTSVTTDSNVTAPPPPPSEDQQEGPRRELSLRAEIGYGQTSLGNVEGLDHQGAFLRAHLAFYPWLSKSRRVGVGVGFAYSYQGLNRKLPEVADFAKSKGQQQALLVGLDLLFRPHAEWFSIQPSALIGLGFFSGGDFWAADRRATIPGREYAFVAGGGLALCTAWDIVCAVGGSEVLLGGVQTFGVGDGDLFVASVEPWGWHVGVGLDFLRMIERGNRTDS